MVEQLMTLAAYAKLRIQLLFRLLQLLPYGRLQTLLLPLLVLPVKFLLPILLPILLLILLLLVLVSTLVLPHLLSPAKPLQLALLQGRLKVCTASAEG